MFFNISYDAGDELACKMLDKRLSRKHLFKRNMTVAELPGGDGQPQGDVDGESQGLMRRMRSQSGHAGTATLASPTHLVPGRFKSHFSSPVGDNSAYQTVALVSCKNELKVWVLLWLQQASTSNILHSVIFCVEIKLESLGMTLLYLGSLRKRCLTLCVT